MINALGYTLRDRRRIIPAGMVGRAADAFRLLSRIWSLSVSNSVAGQGDSSGQFKSLGKRFRDVGILFQRPERRRSSHV